jgi:hypothetical protein
MKIFRIDRPLTTWPAAATQLLQSTDEATLNCLPARLVADSAVNRNDRPAFVPDFARQDWVVEVRPAIHIGRLGKFIATRFADRYISNISLVGLLLPSQQAAEQNRLDGIDPLSALYDSFDGAITAGVQFPFNNGSVGCASAQGMANDSVLKISAEYSCNDHSRKADVDVRLEDLHVEETVALISRFTMLKSGDMIIPASIGVEFPIVLNSSLTATLNSEAALALRLK